MRHLFVLALTVTLAACATAPPPKPQPVPVRSAPMRPVGLERVVGADARALTALFGTPDQDVREEGAVRLQFRSPICVLDAYLYAPSKGKEPVATYIDTRQVDGRDIDRASCVAALVRRKEAR